MRNWPSNFHKSWIEDPITKLRFYTTEQAYMWQKANFFKDEETRKALENITLEPRAAKDLGRIVQNYNDNLWETVRYGFMSYVNYLKYTQNNDLRQQLLDTKDLILVECNPRDRIWGVGLDENDPRAENEATWDGRNLLGKVLMDVRRMVK